MSEPAIVHGARRSARWRGRLLASCAAAVVAAGMAGSAGADPVLVESGRVSFLRHCSSCHGAQARGDGPVATALRATPADLTGIAARRGGSFPEAEISAFIDGRTDLPAHGSREMPVWGRVFAQPITENTDGEEVVRGQLWVLVEYLKSIQQPVGQGDESSP